jgi:hypothetical protein
MTKFGTLIVEPLDKERDGNGLFRLDEDFWAEDEVHGPITVRAGYVTDFASIPRLARWLIPTTGRSAKAAVLHDWVLAMGVTEPTREQRSWAHGIFDRALRSAGCPSWRRWLMVRFVRLWSVV